MSYFQAVKVFMPAMIPVRRCLLWLLLAGLSWPAISPAGESVERSVFPGDSWAGINPAEVGLNDARLDDIASYLGGHGCIVRHGYLAHSWGNISQRGDVASACKPWYAHFLFRAVEDGLLDSLDTPAMDFEPELANINAGLEYKDSQITFRFMANQTSCYGVSEKPGTAFDYNDWQMALFFDTLFLGVHGQTLGTVDTQVLRPQLTDILQCQDNPTFLAFGSGDRAGRLAVSPRDFARFGLLYLNTGQWNGIQILDEMHAKLAVGSPLPNSLPRTTAMTAEMIPGQRSIGSTNLPDDQSAHLGSYSWSWWVNGVDRNGNRFWPDAPLDTYAALGHQNGRRGMAVIPSLDIVIAWNDTMLGQYPSQPHPLTVVFDLLLESATDAPMDGQIIVDPDYPAWLAYNEDKDENGRLDPFFMCGPGDPEGFLYRGSLNPDGTRNGDQLDIIDKIQGTGSNSIYMQVIRSHGGDGNSTHNPFVNNDAAQGLNETILQQWETWFKAMDTAGIVIYLFIYDDSARIWNTGDSVGGEEQAFLETIVQRFSHHRHLIWCVAEEYQERYSANRVRAIAAVIRSGDEHDHPIAVHKLNGLDFTEFADDAVIDQFAIQYNINDPDGLHEGMVNAWMSAEGRYNLNMSETADHGFGASARRKNWSCAMGGAYSMALGWSFDAATAPSTADLTACGDLVRFFESTDFSRMEPRDDLSLDSTKHVLAQAGNSYIAYSSSATGTLGIRDMQPGTYHLNWLDVDEGISIPRQTRSVGDGDISWNSPFDPGGEVAVWIRLTTPTPEPAPLSETILHEDWNTGAIDAARWKTSIQSSNGGGRLGLEDLGGGDYAIFFQGPPETSGSDHTTWLYSQDNFERGRNLRVTFTAWCEPTDTYDWTNGQAIYAALHGPWHTDNTGLIYNNPEAMIRYWATRYFAQPGDAWPVGGTALPGLDTALENATSKAQAIQIRVWLGDAGGARLEWADADGSWATVVDNRGTGGGNGSPYLGWGTYATKVFIDDIRVERDGEIESGFSNWILYP